MFHRNSRVRVAEITDGTSNTMGIARALRPLCHDQLGWCDPGAEAIYNPQRGLGCSNWRPPIIAVLAHSRQSGVNDPGGSPGGFQSQHPGGGNFFFMDGSVRFLKTSTAFRTFWALADCAMTEKFSQVTPSESRVARSVVRGASAKLQA